MRMILSMFRKDLKIYLLSPLAYTIVGAFSAHSGLPLHKFFSLLYTSGE